MIQICLLGTPKILFPGNRIVNLPTRKCALLLAYLVVNRGILHDRLGLAAMLWPDSPESRARRNLNNEIWRLRNFLGDSIAVNVHTAMYADLKKVKVDIDAFDGINARAKIKDLERAITLYRGGFMSGYYDDWVLVKREYYADRLVHSLDRCAKYYQSQSNYRKAIANIRKIILLDPMNEHYHRWLMRLYVLIDDYYSAIWQYRECADLLRNELDVPPMAETTRLYEKLNQELIKRQSRRKVT